MTKAFLRKLKKKSYFLVIGAILIIVVLIALFSLVFNEKVIDPAFQREIEKSYGIESSAKAVRYTHPMYGFSFEKPDGYTVGSFNDGQGGETVVVQKTSNDVAKSGFQIYIYDALEPVELTPQLIKEELPGTNVNNPKKIILDGAPGIMFDSNSSSFEGSSFEIWFIHQGFVYQISSYSEFASELQNIIGSWKFN